MHIVKKTLLNINKVEKLFHIIGRKKKKTIMQSHGANHLICESKIYFPFKKIEVYFA